MEKEIVDLCNDIKVFIDNGDYVDLFEDVYDFRFKVIGNLESCNDILDQLKAFKNDIDNGKGIIDNEGKFNEFSVKIGELLKKYE